MCLLTISDDFEVSIFLTEIGTRHALLVKQKTFDEKEPIRSNSNRLLGGEAEPVTIRDESDDDVDLSDIPLRDRGGIEDDHPSNETAIDDKKKLGFNTTYDGFNIWGFVLCLLVERKGGPARKQAGGMGSAQALMEEWISTQQEQRDES